MSSAFRSQPLRAPEPPREVHSASAQNTASAGRLRRLFGVIWGSVGLGLALVFSAVGTLAGNTALLSIGTALAGAFALAGAIVWAFGAGARRGAHELLRNGIEAEGEVVGVRVEPRMRMNGRSPWRVEYVFPDARGEPVRAHMLSWDPAPPTLKAGDSVVVLHDPKRAARSILWTPLREEPEAVRVAAAAEGVRVEASGEAAVAAGEAAGEAASEQASEAAARAGGASGV